MTTTETIEVDATQMVRVGDLPPISLQEFLKIKKGANELKTTIDNLQICNEASLGVMNLSLKKLNKVIKFIDAARLEATRKIREDLQKANDIINEKARPYQESFDNGKAKVNAYRKAEQERIFAENARIAEENRLAEEKRQAEIKRRQGISKSKGGDGSKITIPPEPEPKKEIQSFKTQDSTDVSRNLAVKVVDVNQVPRIYLDSDKVKDAIRQVITARVQQLINAAGGMKKFKEEYLPDIPGVKLSIEERAKF